MSPTSGGRSNQAAAIESTTRNAASRVRTTLFTGAAAVAVLVLLLGPVLAGRYFGDDFQFVIGDPSRAAAHAFETLHPYKLYRPIQLLIVASSKVIFGDTTLPIHVVNILLHAGLVLLCLRILVDLGAPPAARLITGAWLVFSQLNAPALGGNDTLSLVLGTLSGSCAVWMLYPGRLTVCRFGIAILMYAIALLSKESSLGYLPVVVILAALDRGGRRVDLRGGIVRIAAFLVVTFVYMSVRQGLGGDLPGNSPGQFGIGLNIPRNAAMLLFGAVVPVSTVDVYTGVMLRHPFWPVVGAAGAAAITFISFLGMRREGRLTWSFTVLCVAGCSISPVLFQARVSELYGYALLPAVALVFGWGAAALLRTAGTRTARALTLMILLIMAGQGSSVYRKGVDMAGNGLRANERMPKLVRLVRNLPADAVVLLVEPEHDLPEYSVYRMTGFRLTPHEEIERFADRADISVLDAGTPGAFDGRPLYRLTLDGGEPRLTR